MRGKFILELCNVDTNLSTLKVPTYAPRKKWHFPEATETGVYLVAPPGGKHEFVFVVFVECSNTARDIEVAIAEFVPARNKNKQT